LKAKKDPIHGFLVNPELDAPSVIVDFQQNHKIWLQERNKVQEDLSDALTQKIEEIEETKEDATISTRATRSRAAGAASPRIPPEGSASPRKGSAKEENVPTKSAGQSIISTRRQAAKRQAAPDEEEPLAKMDKPEGDLSEAAEQHSDLITVNQTDLPQAIADAVHELESGTRVLTEDEEDDDDLAAELPDGFYCTSCELFICYNPLLV
jgi:hypothetical protein